MAGSWTAVEVLVDGQGTGDDGYGSLQVASDGAVSADYGFLGAGNQFEMSGLVNHQGDDNYVLPLVGTRHLSTIFGKKSAPSQAASAKAAQCSIDDADKKGILHCSLVTMAAEDTFSFEIRFTPYSC